MESRIEFPDNKKFAICLTHDVDRIEKKWWHSIYFMIKNKDLNHIKQMTKKGVDNPYWNFNKIINLENKYNVKSTFFFLNEQYNFPVRVHDLKWMPMFIGRYTLSQVSEIVKRLDTMGWEVAVHGSFYSFRDKHLLNKEKTDLEKIVGHNVIGIRQHNLNLEIPTTWKLQKEVGFKYDTSFGSNTNLGFKNGNVYPFKPFDDEFLVIPLAVMDSVLFKISKNNIHEAWAKMRDLIKYSEKRNTVLTILWHQRTFNEKEFPGWSTLYEMILREGIKRRAWITKCQDIYNWIVHGEINE